MPVQNPAVQRPPLYKFRELCLTVYTTLRYIELHLPFNCLIVSYTTRCFGGSSQRSFSQPQARAKFVTLQSPFPHHLQKRWAAQTHLHFFYIQSNNVFILFYLYEVIPSDSTAPSFEALGERDWYKCSGNGRACNIPRKVLNSKVWLFPHKIYTNGLNTQYFPNV